MSKFQVIDGVLYAFVREKKIAAGPEIRVQGRVETGDGSPFAKLVLPLMGDPVASMDVPLGVVLDERQLVRWLGDRGYELPRPSARRYLAEYVRRETNRAEVVFKPGSGGWHQRSGEWVYHPATSSAPYGTPEAWRDNVGSVLPGNRYLILATCAALAAVLIRHVLPGQSFVLHFCGRSGAGKSTLLEVGSSVSGDPRNVRSWNGTANGIQAYVQSCRDRLCGLDEIRQGQPSSILGSIFAITNGGERLRSDTSGKLASSLTVTETIVLSTGEVDLRAILSAAGLLYEEGFDARFLCLPVDDEHPSVENRHGRADSAALVRDLPALWSQAYGTIGPAFAEELSESFEESIAAVKELIVRGERRLKDAVDIKDRPRQYDRVLPCFALLGAAGMMARRTGILNLESGQVGAAIAFALKAWAHRQKVAERSPQARVVERLAEAIDQADVQAGIPSLSVEALGERGQDIFRRKTNDRPQLVIRPQAVRNWFASKHGTAMLTLRQLGVLKASEGRFTKSVRVPGRKDTIAMVVIDESLLQQLR